MKSLNRHKYVLPLMLAGQFAAVFLLSVTIFMAENIQDFAIKYAVKLNHGDMSLQQTHLWFGDNAYVERGRKFEDRITAQGIAYQFEQYLAPDEDALLSVEGGRTIEGDSYLYRWIDFEEFDRFSIEEVKVEKGSAVLSATLARRLLAKEGDTLEICNRLSADTLYFPIGAIIPDSEIKIQDANKGYVFLDLDFHKELNKDAGIDFDHAWQKRYYFDGKEEKLKCIEDTAKEIFQEDFEATYSNDTLKVAEDFFSLPMTLLAVFSVICFTISGLILINLLAITLGSRQKELAILNAYGLSLAGSVVFHVIEMLCMLIPVGILGIFSGYICFRTVLHVSTSLGVYSISAYRLFSTVFRLVSAYLLMVLFFTVPYIIVSDSRGMMHVLRGDGQALKAKYILWAAFVFMAVYGVIGKFDALASAVLKVVVGLFVFYGLFLLWMKILGFIKLNSYAKIGLAFLKRSRIRVPVQLLTYTVCFSVTFITLLFGGALNGMAESEIMKESDCNVKVIADYGNQSSIERFLRREEICNYYIIYAYGARYDNTLLELQVYDFDHYDGIMEDRVKKEAGVTKYFSKRCGLEKHSVVSVETMAGASCSFVVGDVSYITPGMEARQRAMAITKEGIDLAEEPDRILYFLKLSQKQQKALSEYLAARGAIKVLGVEDMVSSAASGMLDSKNMFYFISAVFFVITFICVLSCAMITYLNRIKEFAVYYACGADGRIVGKLMLFENLMIVFGGTICGIFLSESLFPLMIGALQFELQMSYQWCAVITFVFITLSVVVTKAVSRMVTIESAVRLIRSE